MLEVESGVSVPDDVVAIGVPVLAGTPAEEGESHPAFDWIVSPDAVHRASGEAVRVLLPGAPAEAWLHEQGFSAGKGASLVLRVASGPPSVVLLGLGPLADADLDRWRLAAAALVRAAGEAQGTAALLVPNEPPGGDVTSVAAAIAEGASLASYRFDAYRSTPKPSCIGRLVVVGHGDWASGLRRGAVTARATEFARDLVNTPARDMTPRDLAERVRERLSGLWHSATS